MRSINTHLDDVLALIATGKVDIFCLQEVNLTWEHYQNLQKMFKGYKIFFTIRNPALTQHGLMVLVKQHIPSTRIRDTKYKRPVESIIIKIDTADGRKIELQNIYVGHSMEWKPSFILHSKDHLGVFVGDFNAKHQEWNNKYANPRGNAMSNWLNDSPYLVVNDDTITTTGNANIDLCIADSKIAHLLNCKILDYMSSDVHYPLHIKFSVGKYLTKEEFVPKFKYDMANWPLFAQTLDNILCNLNWADFLNHSLQEGEEINIRPLESDHTDNSRLTEQVKNIVSQIEPDVIDEILTKAINIATEKAVPKTKYNAKPWRSWFWNEECTTARKLYNRQERLRKTKFKGRPDRQYILPTLQDDLREAKAHFHNTMEKAKKAAWNKICEQLIFEKNDTRTWNKIRFIKQGGMPPVKAKYTDAQERVNNLIDQFAGRSSSNNLDQESKDKLNSKMETMERKIGEALGLED